MTDNVLPFKLPSHSVHTDVTLHGLDLAAVRSELVGFLRKAPYAMGAPAPTGSLTFMVDNPVPVKEPIYLRFTIGVYAHGAFRTGLPISPREALSRLRDLAPLQAISPILNQVFALLDRRRYVLCHAEPVRLRTLMGRLIHFPESKYQWVWIPGVGYESIYLTATYPTP